MLRGRAALRTDTRADHPARPADTRLAPTPHPHPHPPQARAEKIRAELKKGGATATNIAKARENAAAAQTGWEAAVKAVAGQVNSTTLLYSLLQKGWEAAKKVVEGQVTAPTHSYPRTTSHSTTTPTHAQPPTPLSPARNLPINTLSTLTIPALTLPLSPAHTRPPAQTRPPPTHAHQVLVSPLPPAAVLPSASPVRTRLAERGAKPL